VPWKIHFRNPQANLAGVRFKVHYDANEVDLLHVGPADPFQGVTPGGLAGHGGYGVPMSPPPPSALVTSPPAVDAPQVVLDDRELGADLEGALARLDRPAELPPVAQDLGRGGEDLGLGCSGRNEE
jgi:hypothetical protein